MLTSSICSLFNVKSEVFRSARIKRELVSISSINYKNNNLTNLTLHPQNTYPFIWNETHEEVFDKEIERRNERMILNN